MEPSAFGSGKGSLAKRVCAALRRRTRPYENRRYPPKGLRPGHKGLPNTGLEKEWGGNPRRKVPPSYGKASRGRFFEGLSPAHQHARQGACGAICKVLGWGGDCGCIRTSAAAGFAFGLADVLPGLPAHRCAARAMDALKQAGDLLTPAKDPAGTAYALAKLKPWNEDRGS